MDQRVHGSVVRSVVWSVSWPIDRSRRSVDRLIGSSVGRSVSRYVSRSVGWLVGQLVGRSLGRYVSRSVDWLVGKSAGRSVSICPQNCQLWSSLDISEAFDTVCRNKPHDLMRYEFKIVEQYLYPIYPIPNRRTCSTGNIMLTIPSCALSFSKRLDWLWTGLEAIDVLEACKTAV